MTKGRPRVSLGDIERDPVKYAAEFEALHRQMEAMPAFVSPFEVLPDEYQEAVATWPDEALDALTPGTAVAIIQNVRTTARKRGGKKAGQIAKANANEWHGRCATAALKLLQQGTARHKVSGKLASRFGKSTTQVRAALRKAGVLPPRKKRK